MEGSTISSTNASLIVGDIYIDGRERTVSWAMS
jgi:hypothetical protein